MHKYCDNNESLNSDQTKLSPLDSLKLLHSRLWHQNKPNCEPNSSFPAAIYVGTVQCLSPKDSLLRCRDSCFSFPLCPVRPCRLLLTCVWPVLRSNTTTLPIMPLSTCHLQQQKEKSGIVQPKFSVRTFTYPKESEEIIRCSSANALRKFLVTWSRSLTLFCWLITEAMPISDVQRQIDLYSLIIWPTGINLDHVWPLQQFSVASAKLRQCV